MLKALFYWNWFCIRVTVMWIKIIVLFLKPTPHVTEHWLQGRAVHLSRNLWRWWISEPRSCWLFDTVWMRDEVKIFGDRQGGISGHGSWSGGLIWPSQFMSGRANSLVPDTQITERLRRASSPQVTGHSCHGPIHHLWNKSCFSIIMYLFWIY